MNSAFENLSKLQIRKLMDLLDIHIYKFKKNENILSTIRGVDFIGIVSDGEAKIINMDYNGNEIIVENLHKNNIFGSHISEINSENSEIIAKEPSEIMVIDYFKLYDPRNISYTYFNIFMTNVFDIVNMKYKESIERIRILEKKQIRDKLLEFFDIEYKKTHSKYIYLRFPLKDLADYIGSNRSAMFRELKGLKDDRFIEVDNKRIKLIYKEN